MKKPVKIMVKNGVIEVTPKKPKLMPRGTAYTPGEITWQSEDGDATVRFNKNGTPFSASRYDIPMGVDRDSGTAKPHPTRVVYDYTVELKLPDGTELPPLDPQVDVDPESPPPDEDTSRGGGREETETEKKAARKKTRKKKTRGKSGRKRTTRKKARKSTRRRKGGKKTARKGARKTARRAGRKSARKKTTSRNRRKR